jgi:hypothetical protein
VRQTSGASYKIGTPISMPCNPKIMTATQAMNVRFGAPNLAGPMAAVSRLRLQRTFPPLLKIGLIARNSGLRATVRR